MGAFDEHRKHIADLGVRGRRRALAARSGVDFASNDYLGLAQHPALRAAIVDTLNRGTPLGSGGSRLLRGNHPEHEALEAEAAQFFGAERALYFSSGYAANSAVFATLPQRGDLIVYDELIHASAHEGMRLSRAESVSVRHNDIAAFAEAIAEWRSGGRRGRPWIAVESLYSMDGDFAQLAELAALADETDAALLIDEAHATGVFGPDGKGLAAHLEGRENVITLHTCGKAMGCEGALVCAPAIVCEFLINRARGFIFSTAPSPLMAAAVRASLRLLRDEPEHRERLRALYTYAGAHLGEIGASRTGSQIMPLIVGEDRRTLAVAHHAQAAGFDVRAIRPPTVPEGTARLRISITLNATTHDIDGLAAALRDALAEHGA